MIGASKGRRIAMPVPCAHLPEHLRLLLGVLTDPVRAESLAAADWDILVRSARSARLLGTLAERCLATLGRNEFLPSVLRHLDAAMIEARFRHHKLRFLLYSVETAIFEHTAVCVALKGAAYVLQGSQAAAGRLPADVDLLVPKACLERVESALLSAGWEFEKTEDYDQNYYRAWSHELPPMQCAGHALELDLHHAILPPLGQLRPDPELLIEESIALTASPYRVLCWRDQVLHVCVHLFQDSDCTNRLRDLVDLDALLRCPPASERCSARELVARATRLGLETPLAYGVAFAAAWLDCGPARDVLAQMESDGRARTSGLVTTLIVAVLGPPPPDKTAEGMRSWFQRILSARALYLRFPTKILIYHGLSKVQRRLSEPDSRASEP